MRTSEVMAALIVLGLGQALTSAQPAKPEPGFMRAKTIFQTNTGYEPRLAIAVDGVIVHRHGERPPALTKYLDSWRGHGFEVGRMFFADSDATNEYWTGKWDGTPHDDEVERDAKGDVVMCAGVRPYMLPTDGWIRYLEQMTRESLAAGAGAVLPEEPLAHVHTGYEDSFKRIWQQRYDMPWQPESASPAARYLTAQLKNELYIKLERRLAEVTEQHAGSMGRDAAFIVPIHSLYSNVASSLVAPLGTSLRIDGVDGYIGQIWTGPVRWALHHYDSPDKSFFDSAYLLYDYFVALADGTDRKLWLLIDPVEDDPNHQWSEFEEWYIHCLSAMLLFPQVDSYEVMPWPDRIFLPGHKTGGSTPAPERFRIIVLSATQVLQEIRKGGEWNPHLPKVGRARPTGGIGVVLADTVMWEREAFPTLQGVYGMLMPLVRQGIPVTACLLERAGEPGYLDRFDTLVLSYEVMKPADAHAHKPLADWVRRGGSLVVLGEAEDLDGGRFWWHEAGHASPLHHLFDELGLDNINEDGDRPAGDGVALRRTQSPRTFGQPDVAAGMYLPLVREALSRSKGSDPWNTPGSFCLQRGPFVIAHATRSAVNLRGIYVNVLEPDFPVVEDPVVAPGQSVVLRDVSEMVSADVPRILHTTHRLIDVGHRGKLTRLTIRGPEETPAVVRVFAAGREVSRATVRIDHGDPIAPKTEVQEGFCLFTFPNQSAGATLEIRWK